MIEYGWQEALDLGCDANADVGSTAKVPLDVSARRIDVVDDIIERLQRATIGDTCNFYRTDQSDPDAPRRREFLRRYLVARWAAPLVLVGEAAGWRGARLSGIAFTSVAQLAAGEVNEASATIVHRTLAELGLETDVLLWNSVPTHPHRPGIPQSNRRPSATEIAAGRTFLADVCEGRTVVAVGRVAAECTNAAFTVRHPAHGGARAFAAGMTDVAVHLGAPAVPPGGTSSENRDISEGNARA